MPSMDRTWRRGAIWAVTYGVAAVVLPVRSLQIALRLDAIRKVAAWPDWLLALGLALFLGGVSGLFARGAALRRERWIWRQALMAQPRPTPRPDQQRPEPGLELPLTLTEDWRPLWLRILLTPVFPVGVALALLSLFACAYWGLLILVSLINPERFVYHPILQMRFFYLYPVMVVLSFGVPWFGGLSMLGFPRAAKVVVNAEGMTRISAFGRQRTIRWEDARLLECGRGGARSTLGSYRGWALWSRDVVIRWGANEADYMERAALARLISERTGLAPYELKQPFWRRSPLVAHLVRGLSLEEGDSDEMESDEMSGDDASGHAALPNTGG